MMMRPAPLIALAHLLSDCQTPAPAATAKILLYTCDDGRTVQLVA